MIVFHSWLYSIRCSVNCWFSILTHREATKLQWCESSQIRVVQWCEYWMGVLIAVWSLLLLLLSHWSYVRLFTTLWTAAHQAPLSMGFSRQGCWRGLPCAPPWSSQSSDWTQVSCFAGRFFTTEPPKKPVIFYKSHSHFKTQCSHW